MGIGHQQLRHEATLANKAFSATKAYMTYFAEALITDAEAKKSIVGIHVAMGGGTGMNMFAKRFPDRCFDIGIAEQHAVTFATKMATKGMNPFCFSYSFLQQGRNCEAVEYREFFLYHIINMIHTTAQTDLMQACIRLEGILWRQMKGAKACAGLNTRFVFPVKLLHLSCLQPRSSNCLHQLQSYERTSLGHRQFFIRQVESMSTYKGHGDKLLPTRGIKLEDS